MNMLSPKKTKFRKQFKGRIQKFKRNYSLNYGSFGLKAMEPKELHLDKLKLQEKQLLDT